MAFSLVFLSAAIIAWDLMLGWGILEGRTITSVIREWSKSFPLLPFLAGVLSGHLFWP